MYYIYHIKNIKVGCTKNPIKRIIQQQGYKNYKILYKTKCINDASKMELQYQKKLGFKQDDIPYKETINNFKINNMIYKTNKTITLKNTFNQNLDNFKFPDYIEIDNNKIKVTEDLKDFIKKNNYKSQHSNERYVYINKLKNYIDNKQSNNVFDKIRLWAKDRGIYERGDSQTQYVKLMEEAGELAQALLKRDDAEIYDAIGDMVVVLTNLAEMEGVKIEDCIDGAYNEIANRKGKMINGTFVKQIV